MAIPIGATCGLTYIIVIIVLILPEISVLAVSSNGSTSDSVSESIRHKDDTNRVDPLDNFRKYRGGFNITNAHYWSSVVFTGVYGYAIGVLWLLCGVVCGIFWVTINFCCQSDGQIRTKKFLSCNYNICDPLHIPLVVLLMIVAMVTSGLVLAGSSKFHSQAMGSVNIIINTASNISDIIHNATVALEEIRDDLVESNISADVAGKLNSTAEKFGTVTQNIVQKTSKERRIVDDVFKVLLIVTIVVVSMNLIGATTLSVYGVLRFWRAVYLIVIICWFMTVICWLLSGAYFFLENFSNDVCTAFVTFEENPYNNSLSSIIPCVELRSVKSILPEIGARISNLVNEVNSDLSKQEGNSSLNHVLICNPFSAPPERLYQPENCSPNSIKIGDIPKVLKSYTCFAERCGKEQFISESAYAMVESYARSIQNLLNMYPSMEQLLGCQIVKDTFSEVLLKHCKPMKKFARMAWLGMVYLAVSVMFFVVLWTIKDSHEHDHHLPSGSSRPLFTAEKGLELGAAQEIDHN